MLTQTSRNLCTTRVKYDFADADVQEFTYYPSQIRFADAGFLYKI